MSAAPAIDAVVLGSSPTGLYALRELASGGRSVAVADLARGCAFHSRFVRGRGRRHAGPIEGLGAWLSEVADRQAERPLLLPASDVFVEYVLRRHVELGRRFVFADSYRESATHLLDKASFHALCIQHGVATPGVWLAAGGAALAQLGSVVTFPCILKPMLIHHARDFLRGQKVLLAGNIAEFGAQVARIPATSGGWLVQEVIPGPESAITLFGGYIAGDGTPRQAFTGRKLRQYPAGFGSASLVTSEPCDETLRITLDLLVRMGFRGICGAEFKRDPRDGVLKMIEINPRPTLWFQVTHDAGKRIVEAALRDLRDEPPPVEAPQLSDVRWRYCLKDAASAWFYRRQGAQFVFPAPDTGTAQLATRRSWPVFAAGDPLPALAEPVGYLKKVWQRA
jgi:D-aspartate ligase